MLAPVRMYLLMLKLAAAVVRLASASGRGSASLLVKAVMVSIARSVALTIGKKTLTSGP